jgi:hypothetical protein
MRREVAAAYFRVDRMKGKILRCHGQWHCIWDEAVLLSRLVRKIAAFSRCGTGKDQCVAVVLL